MVAFILIRKNVVFIIKTTKIVKNEENVNNKKEIEFMEAKNNPKISFLEIKTV